MYMYIHALNYVLTIVNGIMDDGRTYEYNKYVFRAHIHGENCKQMQCSIVENTQNWNIVCLFVWYSFIFIAVLKL